MNKTHWKKLTNPNYLGAYSFNHNEKERVVTIEKVIQEQVKGVGGRADECIVAYLHNSKPMILNKTNCKIIQKIYKTPYIEDWENFQITLYIASIKYQGEFVDALRIKAKKPEIKEKETLTTTHPSYNDAVTALKAGHTIERIKDSFILSPELEKELLKIKKDV